MWSLVLSRFVSFVLFLLHFQAISCSLLFSNSSSSTATLCHHDESVALMHFKNSFFIYDSHYPHDSYPKTESWKEGTDCCWWHGVMCDAKTGYVIELNLSHSMLYGTFPYNSSFFSLSHLQYLDLSYNDFNSSYIPSNFGLFYNLRYLNLNNSHFVGQVPLEISLLSKLVSLDLSSELDILGNHLSIETTVFNNLFTNLTMLKELDLSSVNMSLVVASSFMNLSSSLISLKLSCCRLQPKSLDYIARFRRFVSLDLSCCDPEYYSGLSIETRAFSKLVRNLSMLRELDLSCVSLSSVSPTSFLNLSSSLSFLSLFSCELSGMFPGAILQRPNLRLLDLRDNVDTIGFLPPNSNWSDSLRYLYLYGTKISIDFVSNLKSLEKLDVRGCNFVGSNLALLGNLTQLNELHLCPNNFDSTWIPYSFGNLKLLSGLLDLSGCNFSGQIPYSLGNLTHLSRLALDSNNLNGQIPSSLGNLTQLLYLNLGYNNLNGQIPSSLENLKQLSYLDLNNNNLNSIPFSLGNLKQLSELDLSNNNLSGNIPSSLGNLTQLSVLYLSNNNLRGSVPNSFANLTQLQELDLSSNQLMGPIPSQFSTLSNLGSLSLSDNLLNETIPMYLFTLPNLTDLNLQNNQLAGQIVEFHHNSSFRLIDLSNNKLYGPIPSSISRLVYLQSLILSSNNKLTGEIPSSICKLNFLQFLDLSNNSLSGPIPKCLGKFGSNLEVLQLRMNHFNGTTPSIFSKGSSLRYINFYSNEFQGQIPRSLINCTDLEFLDLGDNMIVDTFPSFLGALPYLEVLVLRCNKLHGLVKKFSSKYLFPRLRIFDISNNNLSGPLPNDYFDHFEAMMIMLMNSLLAHQYMGQGMLYVYTVELTIKKLDTELREIQYILVAIDFSQNKFTGKIPESIGKLKSLIYLNLSHNCFDDSIPTSLGNLTNLESLDLSSNFLVGRIPEQLRDLTFLGIFNVSYNQLEGAIPIGKQFNTFDNSSYEGNMRLCGFPLTKECNGGQTQNLNPSMEENAESNENGFGWKPVVIGYGCGVIFGVGIGFIVFKTRKHSWFVRMIEVEGYLWRMKFDKFRKARKAQRGRN